MPKKEKKRPNVLIIVSTVIFIATVTVGVVFVYLPFTKRTKALRQQILEERDRNVLIGKIRALGKHLKVYEQYVPEKGRSLSWLLNEVSNMASRANLDVSFIKPGAAEEHGLYSRFYVSLQTISTYHQLGSFISMVETSGKFLKIDSITIQRLDLLKETEKSTEKYRPYDVKADIVISTAVFKE